MEKCNQLHFPSHLLFATAVVYTLSAKTSEQLMVVSEFKSFISDDLQ